MNDPTFRTYPVRSRYIPLPTPRRVGRSWRHRWHLTIDHGGWADRIPLPAPPIEALPLHGRASIVRLSERAVMLDLFSKDQIIPDNLLTYGSVIAKSLAKAAGTDATLTIDGHLSHPLLYIAGGE